MWRGVECGCYFCHGRRGGIFFVCFCGMEKTGIKKKVGLGAHPVREEKCSVTKTLSAVARQIYAFSVYFPVCSVTKIQV